MILTSIESRNTSPTTKATKKTTKEKRKDTEGSKFARALLRKRGRRGGESAE